MALKTRTTSKVNHRTVLSWEREPGEHSDLGQKFLSEVLKLIRSERQMGRLTVDFGSGGGIGSVIFEETEAIPQREIQVEQNGKMPEKHYL
ncbi:MAG: hypothetical protein WBV46_01145 [Terriglobales bacterium]